MAKISPIRLHGSLFNQECPRANDAMLQARGPVPNLSRHHTDIQAVSSLSECFIASDCNRERRPATGLGASARVAVVTAVILWPAVLRVVALRGSAPVGIKPAESGDILIHYGSLLHGVTTRNTQVPSGN